jgi:hypothetical protein
MLSGLAINSPNSFLSSLGVFFKNDARLWARAAAFSASLAEADAPEVMRPCSSRKAIPPFGCLLNRAAPVSSRSFLDLASMIDGTEG